MEKYVFTLDDLAKAISINKQTILKHRAGVRTCSRLNNLPEPYATRPQLLWWVNDIIAWMESKRTFLVSNCTPVIPAPVLPKKRPRGRPTNASLSNVE